MILVWLSKLATSPLIANLLVPALSDSLARFFESRAKRAEEKSAVSQAKAAGKIADNTLRAEALREASRKLSDATRRN